LHQGQLRDAPFRDPGRSELSPEAIGDFKWAVWLILGAAAFDTLDGRLARVGGRESLFGAEFDSLADVVSFGLVPALLVFFLILSPTHGYPIFQQLGGFLSFIYLLCAAIRLARFNVITNPLLHRDSKDSSKDFLGLPVPAAAGTVASLVLALLSLAESDRDIHPLGRRLATVAGAHRHLDGQLGPLSEWEKGRPPDQHAAFDLRPDRRRGRGLVHVQRVRAAGVHLGLHLFRPHSALATRPPRPQTAAGEFRVSNLRTDAQQLCACE